MEINKYFDDEKNIYSILYSYIDNDDNSLENLTELYETKKIGQSKDKLKSFLYLFNKMTKNHFRDLHYHEKIKSVILLIENNIKQSFSNFDIFKIFKNNHLILIYLFSNKIIMIDSSIINTMENSSKQMISTLFYPEIKNYYSQVAEYEKISNLKTEIDINGIKNFDEKRQNGVNDSYISSLIRNDSVEEFIAYINKNNISLIKSKIEKSIYETNPFLINKEVTLIEYSAFYGSIQIFQYLKFSGVELTPSLWLYAIHGRNANIIHLLEEEKIQPEDKTYNQCLMESIKCHHNEIASYINDNYIDFNNKDCMLYLQQYSFHYRNFHFISENENKYLFYYACKFNYIKLVELLLKYKNININDPISVYIKLLLFYIIE